MPDETATTGSNRHAPGTRRHDSAARHGAFLSGKEGSPVDVSLPNLLPLKAHPRFENSETGRARRSVLTAALSQPTGRTST